MALAVNYPRMVEGGHWSYVTLFVLFGVLELYPNKALYKENGEGFYMLNLAPLVWPRIAESYSAILGHTSGANVEP